jgi:two-component system response regulator NreC
VRILLVDDHKMMRDGLRAILEKEESFDVVGEAPNGREAIALTQQLKPQIVIMDISMPDLNGVDAARRIVADVPGVKVIALSMNSDRRYVVAMFEAGAVGYLVKSSAAEELIRAVRVVADGLTYVSPSVASVVVDQLVSPGAPAQAQAKPAVEGAKPKALTPREREVLQLLAEGKSSKDIATKLHLAVPTVETHRRQITEKLQLRSIAELTKYAIREGLTTLD